MERDDVDAFVCETDHEGRPVPGNEPDDAWICVWEISPHPHAAAQEYDVMVERSWQKMLNYVTTHLDELLEKHFDQFTDCDPENKFTLMFRVLEMRKKDYLDIINGNEE